MTRQEFLDELYSHEADRAMERAIAAVYDLNSDDLIDRYRFCPECGFERFTLTELEAVLPDEESAPKVLAALFALRSEPVDKGMVA